ncbi:MAG: tetraacyldisaccharide 4'-kinase [Longimicrobiales bacterium]|nr:tetraacyldisaccharide 4'-kinase [Longimicrobiales bacterium]
MEAGAWMREVWEGRGGWRGSGIRALLLPAEYGFRGAVALRGAWYRRRPPPSAALPVVSVGNLSVGGTGKTPVASWVARVLCDGGLRPALVTGGAAPDEAALHRRWTPDLPVLTGRDRRSAVARAEALGARCAVLDDGFQHRALPRELDLVLVSAEEGLPGALLPRGPFREPCSALGRAGAVVVTRKLAPPEVAEALVRTVAQVLGEGASRDTQGGTPVRPLVARLWLAPGAVRPLGDRKAGPADGEGPAADASGRTRPHGPVPSGVAWVVASGVAHPASVAEAVASLGLRVHDLLPFPDHHRFTRSDVLRILQAAAGRPVVVTEKDAVKLEVFPEALGADFHVLEQRLVWEAGEEPLVERIMRIGTEAGR